MIELQARERGFCVARIDLNRGDVESELTSSSKLFDAAVASACAMQVGDAGCFGGISGRTYETYLDMISAYTIPTDRLFCPFLFPLQYARAKASGIEHARVSDQVLRHDLELIRTNTKVHVVILIDECDLLSLNQILLQMLRNLFMNLSGFMLVFAGTDALFPRNR